MHVAAGLGLFEYPFADAGAFWDWVDLCEDGGVDSLWQSDRLVTEQPMLECMSTMAALAGRTRRLKFGMNVASAGLRDPLLLARQCATIDVLSAGRILPAFGIGSPHSADWRATGTDPRGRGRRTDEALDIISALWRGERVTHHSEFFHYEEASISPLPVQRRLPLWIGGSSRAAIRRTARIGTGWLGGRETPAEAGRVVEGVRAACRDTGRHVPDDHYGGAFAFRFGNPDDAAVRVQVERSRQRFPDRDPLASMAVGGCDEVMARIEAFAAVDVTKLVLRPMGAGDADLMAQTRRFVDEVLPALGALNAARREASPADRDPTIA